MSSHRPDDTTTQQQRLQALMARHRSGGAGRSAVPASRAPSPEARAVEPGAEPETDDGSGEAGGGGRRGQVMERALRFLTETTASSRLVPGLPVDADRLAQFVARLRRRAGGGGEGQGGTTQAARLLERLTTPGAPEEMFEGVNLTALRQILRRARQRVGQGER